MVSKSSVKYIQSLQQKKFRDEYGVFVAEGPKVVPELVATQTFQLMALYGTSQWLLEQENNRMEISSGVIFEISQAELERMSGLKSPNSCLAIFRKKETIPPVPTDSLILMLDELQDPGNLGTIIRTADWFGVKQIICSPETTDCYNPKVVQSTMASLGRVEVYYQDLREWLTPRQDKILLCSSLQGVPLSDIEPAANQVLVIGNESKGVNASLLAIATALISIPKIGEAESLNAAVATGIMLSHFCKF